MRRVLITGGFGFLGRHLVDELAAKAPEVEVVAADLQGTPAARRDGVHYAGGVDILKPDSIAAAVEGCDAVMHLAGLVSFWSGDRERLFEVNQVGTRNVAMACARAGVKRLVHVSSVAAIGFNDREDEPADENLAFDWSSAQTKHYMLSKRAAEDELAHASRAGVSVVCGNPGLMYGPGDRTNLALFQAVQAGRMPVVPPGGTNVVDVRDVAAGLRLLLLSNVRDERFILGGHNLRFTEIVRTIARVVRAPAVPRRMPIRLHTPMHYAAWLFERCWPKKPSLTSDHVDSSFRFRYFTSRKAAAQLEWRARIPFAQTVAETASEMVRIGSLNPIGGDSWNVFSSLGERECSAAGSFGGSSISASRCGRWFDRRRVRRFSRVSASRS